ncbi:MAG TPA: peptidoglycan-associated lipoprotein Pal [Nitrospira sp.]|nr:peptidoglycan-associated lipoprotein Pal [Nitrospira sp.]
MGMTPFRIALALAASVALVGASGCSKKSVQSGGDTQSSQPSKTAKSESTESSKTGIGNFPDTSMQSGGGAGLRGLDKNPSEERVGNGSGAGAGSLLAKADTSDTASRQMDEIRAEQAASAAAGLRDIYFGYDSWTISDDQRQALNRDADWMKSNGGAIVKVEGHCDERGTSAYNLVLGEKRAKAVRNYLVELGISANRLSVVSYGKERPSCLEHAESCYQQNRRGHLVVKTGK